VLPLLIIELLLLLSMLLSMLLLWSAGVLGEVLPVSSCPTWTASARGRSSSSAIDILWTQFAFTLLSGAVLQSRAGGGVGDLLAPPAAPLACVVLL
jgi:hypothetical protein